MDTKPSHLPLTSQNLAEDFFSGPGPVHVEARDAAGLPASAESRRVTQALLGPKRWLAGAILGLSAMGASTGAAADDFFNMSMPELSSAEISQMVRDAVGPSTSFVVTSTKGADSQGPSASIVPDGKGGRTCSVSIYKLDETAWSMSSAFRAENAMRMRSFVIDHEAAHCEFFNRMDFTLPATGSNFLGLGGSRERVIKANRDEPIGSGRLTAAAQHEFVDQLDSIFIKKVGVQAIGGSPMYTLMSENYADVRTVLRIARNTLSNASTPQQLKTQLKAFNEYIGDVYEFRHKTANIDPLHDSSLLMKQVQAYVNTKTSTPDGLKSLREDLRNDSNISAMALKLAAGSVIERSQKIHTNLIEQLVDTLPDDPLKLGDGANQRLKEAAKALPKLRGLLTQKADLGYHAEDFEGAGRVLAQEAIKSYQELASSYKAGPKTKANNDTSTHAALDNLQAKLQTPNALIGRIMSGSMLGGHDHSHDHHHHRRPGMKP